MFHPAKGAVLRSDLSLGTVVLMAPLAPLLPEPLMRFNLATWMALAFSGWAFCLLASTWTESIVAGVFSGLTAVMGSHQSLHYVHLNLLSVGWLPIFVLAIERLVAVEWPAFVPLAALSFALVASSSGYYAVAAVVLALVVFARTPSIPALKRGLAAAFLALVLLLPYLLAYAGLHRDEGLERTSRELAKGSWTLADLGSRTIIHRVWNGGRGEPLFPGFAVTGLALLGLWRGGKRERTLGVAALLLFWLGLGETGGLYRLIASVPPFSSMRHPVTLTAVGLMLICVVAASALASIEKRSRLAASAILLLAAGETLAPQNDFFNVAPGVPRVYEELARRPQGPVLEVPPYEASTLIWASRQGFETLNGGGAFIPAITNRIETAVQNHWLTDSYQPIDDSKAAGILLNETSMRYLILPGGRRGGLNPLIQRFRECGCFKELGVYGGDLLFEAVRDSSCRAWSGALPQSRS